MQTVNSHGISTVMDDERFHHCLYQGFIHNLSASSAAISTCSGLVSLCIPKATIASELIIFLCFLHSLGGFIRPDAEKKTLKKVFIF